MPHVLRTVICPVVVATLALLASAAGVAQTTKPAFEVVSIRPGTAGTPMTQRVTPGRLDIVNTPLRSLVAMAFRIKEGRRLSVPDWLSATRFDIQATFPASIGRAQVPDMLRALLAERFGLVARVEQRLEDGYEFVVGKDGIRMRKVEAVDEIAKDFGSRDATDRVTETLDGPVRMMMVPLGLRTVTSTSLYSTSTAAGGTVHVDATRITMAEFAENILAPNVDRPVIDKTGLDSVYEFKVVLDSNASAIRGLRSIGITTTVQGNPIGQLTGVSTFKAVESLGLRLEERRVPADFVVVEQIERTPTQN